MKFRLLAGKFYHGNKMYKAGDEIQTEMNLEEIFKNKFEKVVRRSQIKASVTGTVTKIEKEVTKEEAEEMSVAPANLEMKHKGGNRWVVLNKDTGEQVNDGYLKRKEAEALVNGDSVEE